VAGRTPHIVIDVSAHGWGHATQVAALVAELCARPSACRLTIRSQLGERVLSRLIGPPFACAPPPPDPCLVMTGPTEVERAASLRGYLGLHDEWPARVAAEADALDALGADLLLSDIGYVGLAAARRAGVPAVALCSLNWADMFRAFCGDHPRADAIHRDILEAYRGAEVFLQPTPHMPMADLPNRRSIGVLADRGSDRRDGIRRALGLPDGTQLVLMTLGGIHGGRSATVLPHVSGVHWIAGENEGVDAAGRDDLSFLADLSLGFPDVLASCDAVVTKTGYGTLTQAAAAGVRVLYVTRPDWPESASLEPWIETHGTALPIDGSALAAGTFGDALRQLLARPAAPPVATPGARQAADALAGLLGAG